MVSIFLMANLYQAAYNTSRTIIVWPTNHSTVLFVVQRLSLTLLYGQGWYTRLQYQQWYTWRWASALRESAREKFQTPRNLKLLKFPTVVCYYGIVMHAISFAGFYLGFEILGKPLLITHACVGGDAMVAGGGPPAWGTKRHFETWLSLK